MRVFKNRSFARFARKAGISDQVLCDAVGLLVAGRSDADLGHGLYKQRIARAGEGKSGGYRTIVVLKIDRIAFFIYGFAKSDVANLTLGEVTGLKKLARYLLALEDLPLAQELSSGLLIEVECKWKSNIRVR